MNLFIEFFNHIHPLRNNEIRDSLKYNLSLSFIDKLYVFGLDKDLINLNISHDKLKLITVNHRCTFQDIINHVNKNIHANDINIMSNNDILLDSNMANIRLNHEDFYAIPRWEPHNTKKPWRYNKCDSQDVWVWKGQCKISDANFYFGTTGCDGKLAYLANICGYRLINPAFTYRCLHNHLSCVRTSAIDPSMIVIPPYHKICPSFI